METAVRFTPSIKVGPTKARRDRALFTGQHETLYSPKTAAGQRARAKAKVSPRGYVKYYLRNRYPAALWRAIKARRAEHLRSILAARGLAQKSWYRIMAALGVEIRVPTYVKNARPSGASGFTDFDDVSATVQRNESRLVIHTVNAQPTVNYPNVKGEDALRRAIAGRVKYFHQNIKHRVFNDLAKIARAYPGLKVSVPQEAE